MGFQKCAPDINVQEYGHVAYTDAMPIIDPDGCWRHQENALGALE